MQKARSYIYTTALPQPVAAASRKALEIAQRETWRRERVLALAARFRSGAAQAGCSAVGRAGDCGCATALAVPRSASDSARASATAHDGGGA